MPAYGGVALRASWDHGASQVNLEAARGGVFGHCPEAVNALTLTAFGQTVIDHERYQRTRTRNYRAFTGAWNTVVVNQRTSFGWKWHDVDESARLYYGALPPIDSSEAPYSASGGDVVLFEAGLDGVSIVESDGYRAYYPWTSRYTRWIGHDASDAAHPLTVDIFRVSGGQHHEFYLHGDTQMNQAASASFLVEALDGKTPLLGADYDWESPPFLFGFDGDDPRWYGVYRNVSRGAPPGEFVVEWRGECDGEELPLCDGGVSSGPTLKIWGLTYDDADDGTETTLSYLATDPHNWRYEYPDDDVDPFGDDATWRQTYLERRVKTGAPEPAHAATTNDALESLFVHVYEPTTGDADDPRNVARVERGAATSCAFV